MSESNIQESQIGELVRKMESDFQGGNTLISKYVSFNLLEILNTIDAYHYSKHISGDKDSLGRDKPFPNIVVSAENIWYRATDIDRGQIKIRAKKSKDTINAFLKTIHIQNWMRDENFGIFLNEWGRTLSRYGSAVVKFIEKDGELHRMVVPWQSLIVDSVDFDNNPVIEVLDLTEAQLYKREGYDKEVVEKLCEAKTSRKTLDGQNKDNKNDYIRLYEVHGELPLSYLTGKDEDDDTFVQQMHVISYVAGKEEGQFDDYTLVSGKEKQSPYMITHLIKEEGRTLSIGPVEYLFEAQWMMNHTAKAIKDQLDLSSKLIFQTNDGSFVGQNALNAIENGDILIYAKDSNPLTQLQNNSHDISSLQSYANQWKVIGNEITGVSESMMGKAAVSGTAWRQVEALLTESHDLFELMTQNKGLAVEEMFKKFIIPFVNKKMDTSEEIAATLEANDIERIDSMYIKNMSVKQSNKIIKDKILYEGQAVTQEEQADLMMSIQNGMKEGLQKLGNQRFFKPDEIDTTTWKELFKDSDDEVYVDVTTENRDKDAMTTLNTLLMYIAKKNGQPMSNEEKFVFNTLLRETGVVSELQLANLQVSSNTPQQQSVSSPIVSQQMSQPMVK